jgi:tetratricopeptide (TPR) repeat protein
MGGQMGGPGGQMGRPGTQSIDPSGDDTDTTPHVDKPDIAAKKAFNAGVKSMNKAKEFEAAAAAAPNADKKAKELEKVGDAYTKALDQFTEALSNQADLYQAWNYVGFIHLRLGAYVESVDDYNHGLALKPDNLEAIEYRAEAYMAIDRLDDAKSAYMDLYNHDPGLADRLMSAMQKWVTDHRADANGIGRMPTACLPRISTHSINGFAIGTASPNRRRPILISRPNQPLSASMSARSCRTNSSRRLSR